MPDFNAGAMENPGCVTLRDQFIYRSRATAAERGLARRRGGPRDGAHVVRRPGDHDLVGRPVAQRVLRGVHGPPLLHRGHPRTSCGPSSASCARTGARSPTRLPRPTRWPATGPPTPSRLCRTSTASPTPRGRRCSSSWRPTSATRCSSTACGTTSTRHAYGNATFADLIAAWTAAGAVDLAAWADGLAADRRPGHPRRDRRARSSQQPVRPSAAARRRRWPASTPTVRSWRGPRSRSTERWCRSTSHREAALMVPDAADETWAKIRFGDRPWTEVIDGRPEDRPIAATRVVVANALRDAVRDGELDPADGPDRPARPAWPPSRRRSSSLSLLRFAIDQLCGPYLPPQRSGPTRWPACTATIGPAARRRRAGLRPPTAPSSASRCARVRTPTSCARWLDRRDLPTGPRARHRAGLVHRRPAGDAHRRRGCHRAAVGQLTPRPRAGPTPPRPGPGGRPRGQADGVATADAALGSRRVRAVRHRDAASSSPSQTELCAAVRAALLRRDRRHRGRSAPAGRWDRSPRTPTRRRTPSQTSWRRAEAALDRTELAAPLRRSIVDGTDTTAASVVSRSEIRAAVRPAKRNG